MDELGSCGGLIKQIHDALEKSANNAMRPQGMTMAQYGVLLALNRAENGTLPLKELEQLLRVAQSTAAGEACCRQAERNMEQTEANLLSGLTETERSIFLTLLKKVRDTLQ